MGALTAKQQAFVDEYLIDLNATQAAIRAGYSEKTAKDIACENLAKPYIAEAIAEAKAARSERTGITQDSVLREIARLGFSDLRKVFTPGGALLDPQEWDDDTAATIASVEVVTRPTGEKDDAGGTVVENIHKIKVWDKNAALEKLAKHLNLYSENNKVDVSDRLADVMRAVAANGGRLYDSG